jgi:hypothetical protein
MALEGYSAETVDSRQRLFAIGAFRAVGGLSSWLTPNLLARVYGGGLPNSGELLWSRLAGSRELALAAGPLLSDGGEDQRLWLQLGLACDVADMGATLLVSRRNGVGGWTTALALTTYTVSALLTGTALRSVN